jgi:hypothetical protein
MAQYNKNWKLNTHIVPLATVIFKLLSTWLGFDFGPYVLNACRTDTAFCGLDHVVPPSSIVAIVCSLLLEDTIVDISWWETQIIFFLTHKKILKCTNLKSEKTTKFKLALIYFSLIFIVSLVLILTRNVEVSDSFWLLTWFAVHSLTECNKE